MGAWAGQRYMAKPALPSDNATEIRTIKVNTGSIQKVLRLSGSTRAKNFRLIAAPRMRGTSDAGRNLILIYVAPAGSTVKKGDVVAQIDAQALRNHVDDIEAQIVQTDAAIKLRIAQQQINLEKLRQQLRVAKAQVAMATLDLSAAEVRAPLDVELLKLTKQEAQATYNELLSDMPNVEASNAFDLRNLEIGRELQVRHRKRHLRDIEEFTLRAPLDGLVVMQTIRRAGEWVRISAGDRVAPAQPFMRIVNTRDMRVEALASQVEAEELRLGQRARIRFDAFPSLKLNAEVTNIGAIATPGVRMDYFHRTIPVSLSIVDKNKQVIPDLTTSSDIIVDQMENAPLIPFEAIESKNGKSFVRVKTAEGFQTREVELGADDNLRIAVDHGVKSGEEVALD